MSDVVLPVLGLLLEPGEVRALQLAREPAQAGLQLDVALPGTRFRLHLWEQDGLDGMFVHLFSVLQEYIADQSFAWAQARPACPGHPHPVSLLELDGRLWLVCPADRRLLRALR